MTAATPPRSDVTSAEPSRAHLAMLREATSAPIGMIAATAGVSHAVTSRILCGRQQWVSPRTEARYLAVTVEAVRTRRAATAGPKAWVPAGPAAEHMRALIEETGASPFGVSKAAGVHVSVVTVILAGRQQRLCRKTETLLLALTADDVLAAHPLPHQVVDAAPAMAHLRSLLAECRGAMDAKGYVAAATGVYVGTLRRYLADPPERMFAEYADLILSTRHYDVARRVAHIDAKTRPSDRVDPGPARAHVAALLDSGLDVPAIALAAGLAPDTVRRLIADDAYQAIRRDSAECLLAVTATRAWRKANLVPTEQATAHVRRLFDEVPSATVQSVARAVGLSDRTVLAVREGTQATMSPRRLARILATTPAQVEAQVRLVSSDEAVWMCRTMQALGWSMKWQAAALGHPTQNCPPFMSRHTGLVSRTVADQVAVLHREIGDRVATPDNSGLSEAHIRRTIRNANAHGYYPPAAYDEDRNLLTDAVRTAATAKADAAAEFAERMEALDNGTRTAPEIAAIMGCDPKTVRRARDARQMRAYREAQRQAHLHGSQEVAA